MPCCFDTYTNNSNDKLIGDPFRCKVQAGTVLVPQIVCTALGCEPMVVVGPIQGIPLNWLTVWANMVLKYNNVRRRVMLCLVPSYENYVDLDSNDPRKEKVKGWGLDGFGREGGGGVVRVTPLKPLICIGKQNNNCRVWWWRWQLGADQWQKRPL